MADQKTEGKIDKGKGRVKESAGDLTDDDSLKNEGKADRTSGGAKEKVGEAADKVSGAIGKLTDKAKGKN